MSGTVKLLGFEVGGLNLPVLYQSHPVGSIHVTLRYARNPYLTLYCQVPHRHATVVGPESSEVLAAEEVDRFLRRRIYRLTGAEVDETARRLSNAVCTDEVEEIMAPYINYVAENFSVA